MRSFKPMPSSRWGIGRFYLSESKCTVSAHRLHICPNRGLFCARLAQPAFLCIKRRTLSEQGSRQLSAFVCIHQPDGFKDLLTGDFCCLRLFILLDLGCCQGQVLGVEVRFDLFCQFQTGFVETLLVHPDAGADAQYPESFVLLHRRKF